MALSVWLASRLPTKLKRGCLAHTLAVVQKALLRKLIERSRLNRGAFLQLETLKLETAFFSPSSSRGAKPLPENETPSACGTATPACSPTEAHRDCAIAPLP